MAMLMGVNRGMLRMKLRFSCENTVVVSPGSSRGYVSAKQKANASTMLISTLANSHVDPMNSSSVDTLSSGGHA